MINQCRSRTTVDRLMKIPWILLVLMSGFKQCYKDQATTKKGRAAQNQRETRDLTARMQEPRTNSTTPLSGNTDEAASNQDQTGPAGQKHGPATCSTGRSPSVRNLCRGLRCATDPAGTCAGGVEANSSGKHTGQIATRTAGGTRWQCRRHPGALG
jgi:hypothetical protein